LRFQGNPPTCLVVEEIEKHRPVTLTAKLPFRVLRGQNHADKRLLTMCRIFALDIGETEALIIMENHPECLHGSHPCRSGKEGRCER
jgi:hypothetical protein